MVVYGVEWQARLVEVCQGAGGQVRNGAAGMVRKVMDGMARLGWFRQVWRGKSWQGLASSVKVRLGRLGRVR